MKEVVVFKERMNSVVIIFIFIVYKFSCCYLFVFFYLLIYFLFYELMFIESEFDIDF